MLWKALRYHLGGGLKIKQVSKGVCTKQSLIYIWENVGHLLLC